MEPNKIEKQFREKLNAREIQPSAQAWDRLDAMLSVTEEKKTKRPFGWLYIAAGVLVFVTLGTFFFTSTNPEVQPENNVVETEVKKDSVQNEVKNSQSPVIQNEKQNEAVASSENQSTPHKSIIPNKSFNQNNQNNQKTNANQNQIIRDKTIEFQNPADVALKDLPKIESPKGIIVGKENSAKSDEFLVASLDNAAKQSTTKNKVVKVDAKSLLSQVDGEVEYTFREKTFNKLNKNYQEIKVALANRNTKE